MSYSISYSVEKNKILIEINPEGKVKALSIRYSANGDQTDLVLSLS